VSEWESALGEDRFNIIDSPSKEDNPFRDAILAQSTILIGLNRSLQAQGRAVFLTDYGPCACDISLRPEATDEVLILVHELGHCLGLTHSDPSELYNVMGAFFLEDAFITQESVDLVKANTHE
jgi:hypothetical protein